MARPSQESIIETVNALLAAQTWEKSKHIVETQPDKLLTDTADQYLILFQERGDVLQ